MIRPIAYIVTALIGLLILGDNPPQTVNLQFFVGFGAFIGGFGTFIWWLGMYIKANWSEEW